MAATPDTTRSPLDQHASPVADHATSTGRRSGLATAALVLGIIAIPSALFWPVALILGILAIVLGSVAKGQINREGMQGSGMATAGIVCGAIGIAAAIAFVAIVVANA